MTLQGVQNVLYCQMKCMYDPFYSSCVSINYIFHNDGNRCSFLSDYESLESMTESIALDFILGIRNFISTF